MINVYLFKKMKKKKAYLVSRMSSSGFSFQLLALVIRFLAIKKTSRVEYLLLQ